MPDVPRIVASIVEFWNTGNPEIAKKLYSEGAERRDPNQAQSARGPQEIARYVAEVHTGYPDFELKVNETVAEGNCLVTHWTCTGTHKGNFQGISPTGKRISISGLSFARMENDKIAEERVYFDRLAMLEQLGIAPPAMPGQGSAAMSST